MTDQWSSGPGAEPRFRPVKLKEVPLHDQDQLRTTVIPKKKPKPPWWHKPMANILECIFILILFFLVKEAIETAGIEINDFFADSVMLGWLFKAVPELTAKEPMAGITAVFFVAVPIAFWRHVLEDHPAGSTKAQIVRSFLVGCYAVTVTAEVLLVIHRVELGQNILKGSGVESSIAFFLAVIFVLANSCAAFWTASVYLAEEHARNA